MMQLILTVDDHEARSKKKNSRRRREKVGCKRKMWDNSIICKKNLRQ